MAARTVRLSFLLAASAGLTMTALAQQDFDQAPQDEPLEAFASGPSELDILSRGGDDPFQQIGDAEKRKPISVTLRALDKITARYRDIEAPMDEVAVFGTLEILPRFCDKRPPEEFPETTAFLQIFDKGNKPKSVHTSEEETSGNGGEPDAPADSPPISQPPGPDAPLPEVADIETDTIDDLDVEITGESIFSGWMFASSPALNPLEHAVYDVWVIDCNTAVAER